MNHQVTLGRIVQYQRPQDSEPTAAIITQVLDMEQGIVHLTLFTPGSNTYAWDVHPATDDVKVGRWSWPVRVS